MGSLEMTHLGLDKSDSVVDQVSHSRRVSSVVGSDSETNQVSIEHGVDEVRISFATTERDCRICQLSLDMEPGNPIKLGCSCMNELAGAHLQCAEKWFRIKGNKICEICNSVAQNIVVPGATEWRQQISEASSFSARAFSSTNSERGDIIMGTAIYTPSPYKSNVLKLSASPTEMTSIDLECNGGSCFSAVTDENNDEIIAISEAVESFGCSNNGHKSDSEVDQVLHSRRVSSVVGSDSEIDRVVIEYGVDEVRISFGTTERDCRICQLSLDVELGNPIELGCSCKNELASAHQQCAQTWFRIKGNKICEICNLIAENIVIAGVDEFGQKISEANPLPTSAFSAPVSANSKSVWAFPYIGAAVFFVLVIFVIVGNLTKGSSS